MRHVVIVGNGITGTTVARQLRKRTADRITIVSKESDFFFSRPALMYVYMGHMTFDQTKPYEDWFWKKNNIDLVRDEVLSIDFEAKELRLASAKQLPYDVLVLALGSTSRFFHWKGIDAVGVQGLYSVQDLGLMEENTQGITSAGIVGGGLIGVEVAEMLRSRNIDVHMVVREPLYWSSALPKEEASLITHEIRRHGVHLHLGQALEEVVRGDSNRVEAIRTNKNQKIPMEWLAVTIGVQANIDLVKGTPLALGSHGILVNRYLETSVDNVYAAGDCSMQREPFPNRKSHEPLWYTGKMQGECLGKTIAGERTEYNPGIWFNSAKFFDVEYQTYGLVGATLSPDEETLYWEDGSGRRCVRINYNKATKVLTGFNFLGVRARHNIAEEWLEDEKDIVFALEHLGALNFDPEFFKGFERQVIEAFQRQEPSHPPIRLKAKKGTKLAHYLP